MLRGYDSDAAAIRAAIENSERAKLRGFVHFERRELEQLVNQSTAATGLVATNPPYGERIGDQERLTALYGTLGQKMREHFQGWKAAVLTGNPPLAKAIGIHARRSHTLFNGRIECRLLRFDVTPEDFQQPRRPPPDAAETRARPGAQMFANRLRKNLKSALDWAQRESIDCFRIYDADMPEYAFAIDQYGDGAGNRWVVVQEYAPPRTVDAKAARQRRDEALAVIPHELDIATERMFVRERRQQKQGTQYEKLAREREFDVVREQPYRFFVNFTDYLDTGLFLDHRPTRRLIGELAQRQAFPQSLRVHRYRDRLRSRRRRNGIDHRRYVPHVPRLGETQSRLERAGHSRARFRAGELPHVAGGAAHSCASLGPDVHRSADALALEANDGGLRRAARPRKVAESRARIADPAWHDRLLQQLHALQARCGGARGI